MRLRSSSAMWSSADVATPATSNQPLSADEQDGIGERREVRDVESQDSSGIAMRHRYRASASAWWSTRWSMQAVRACTSDVSIAGNMPMRNWLRPSLR